MKMIKVVLHIVLLLVTVVPAVIDAQGIKGGKVATKVGNWTVFNIPDPITDRINCVGVLKGDVKAQLARDSVYVPVSGGIQTVTLRFGDAPARSMRLGTKMEKDVRSLIIDGSEFSEAIEAKRLRGQVLTLVSGVVTFDLDMTGIQEALESVRSDCPIQTEPVAVPVVVPKEVAKQDVVQPVCSDRLLSRMKEAKVTAKQISAICAK